MPISIRIPPKSLKIRPKLSEIIGNTIPKTVKTIFKDIINAKKTNGTINKDNKNMEPSLLKPDRLPGLSVIFLRRRLS